MVNNRKGPFLAFFLLILALELIIMFYLISGRRMVIGHDGFELFAHQWFFINSGISHHEFPLWSPYLNQGTPVWWYFIYSRMDMFSNAVMMFAPWIKAANFLGFFYGSLFFDKFILLCGVWLLAGRYFSRPVTVFFVASTVLATTVTYTQNSFPLVMVYVLPLIIYLLHRFFDTFNWRWLFLTVFLFCTVSINVFYFIPIISLAVFIYFLTAACISRGEFFKGFKIRPKDLVWISATALLLLLLGAMYWLGHDPLIFIKTTLRLPDGKVPLNVFLSYGGDNGLFKWWELFLGISLRWDYTLYMGLLCIPLILIGILFSKNPNRYIFIWSALFFLLFSGATTVSVLAYYFWPLMGSFRHIGYVAPLIKLYLCFLAGFGFERLFDPHQDQKPGDILKISMLASAILLLNAVFLSQLIIKPQVAHFMLRAMGPDIQHRVSLASINDYFSGMALLSVLASLVFFFRPFINFSKYSSSYLIILLFLHLGIIYWYAYDEIQLRTFPMTQKEYALMDFGKVPFYARRVEATQEAFNPRQRILGDMQGTITDPADNFTFSDSIESQHRSDFYIRPMYQLFSIFRGHERSVVFNKLAGASQDKVQFFSKAYFVDSPQSEILKLTDKKYAGDILFYSSSEQEPAMIKNDLQGLDLSQDQRLVIPYQVLFFSPDQIVISVDTKQSGVWMQYSDAWHPSWKAKINGRSQKLYIGSLAYKALPLQRGKNVIRLYVGSKPVECLYGFFTVSSFVWIILLVGLLIV